MSEPTVVDEFLAAVPISDIIRSGKKLTDDQKALEVMMRLRASAEYDSVDRLYIWPRNQAFTYGEQSIEFNRYGKAWLRQPVERKQKPIRNIIQARVLDQTARLVQQQPMFSAAAENSDQSTRRKTESAEGLLYHRWRTCKIGHARRQVTRSALIKGLGVIEYGWDEEASFRGVREPLRDATGAVQVDDEGGTVYPDMGRDDWKTAKAEPVPGPYCNKVSPENFYPPPGVTEPTLNACCYVIRTMWMGEEQIRKKFDYPRPNPLDETAKDMSIPTVNSNWLASIHGRIRNSHQHYGQFLVVQYFEPATDVRGFAYGKVYTVVGTKLIHEDRSQFRDGRYPFVLFPWLPRDGMFMPEAWVSSMIDPQIAYNDGKFHAYDWLNRASNPNILAPQNSGIREQIAFNFHTLYYQPGFGDVKMLQAPPLSPVVQGMMQDALQDIDRVSNQGPFLRGDPVPGVPAASYARMMAAAAASHLGQFNADWSESWADLGTGLLMLEREYGSEDEMMVIVGKSNRPSVLALKRSDLDDDLPIVVSESSLSVKSPDARQETLKGLLDAGVYNPQIVPADLRNKLVAFMDMPDLNDIEDGSMMLERFAKDALSKLIDEGIPMKLPPVFQDEPVVLGMLKDKLVERSMGEDMWAWPEEKMKAVTEFKGQIMQALQALQQQQQQEQMKQQQDQLGLMAQGEKIKSDLRTKEKFASIAGEAGAEVIKADHMPPKPAPSNGAPKGAEAK